MKFSSGYKITALLLLLSTQMIRAETVNIPLKIDFPLLHKLLVSQLFTDNGNTKEILHDPGGCREITLSDPKLSESNKHLQINAKVSARLAIKLIDSCVSLLTWNGQVQIIAQPTLQKNNNRVIYLHVLDSQLIGQDNKVLTSGPIWDQANRHIQPFFDQFKYDLSPSINELKDLLPLFLTEQPQLQLGKALDSFHLGNLHVAQQGIGSRLVFDVEAINPSKQYEQVLNLQEQQQWQKKWQSMDALLTQTIKHYASATELKELRLALFDILIDSRFQLQQALQQNQLNDPVRRWFIESWSKLIPLIQQISVVNPQYSTTSLMTVITASDALLALDKLGGSFGLDISIDGLRRLARLINNNTDVDSLKYDEKLDPQLIQLFQFNPNRNSHSKSSLSFWPVGSVQAADNLPLNNWIPNPDNLDSYLLKVRKMLLEIGSHTLQKSAINMQQQTIFKKLVMATAWQESCWQQYVVKEKKIIPLRSSTGDTGIMQVNEKIWRGFLDNQKLRWDIAYNIEAGSNILLDYMTRYAIKKDEQKQHGGMDNLARSTYSIYNGGPGQVARYRKTNVANQLKKIDSSFYSKYQNVKNGKELTVAECLGGRIAPIMQAKTEEINKPTKSNKTIIHNEAWVKQQGKNYFTLQLGVFSSSKAANAFIKKQNKAGNYAIYKHHNNKNQSFYTIIYGFYSTHLRAKKEAKLFKKITPWVRQFKNIRASMSL